MWPASLVTSDNKSSKYSPSVLPLLTRRNNDAESTPPNSFKNWYRIYDFCKLESLFIPAHHQRLWWILGWWSVNRGLVHRVNTSIPQPSTWLHLLNLCLPLPWTDFEYVFTLLVDCLRLPLTFVVTLILCYYLLSTLILLLIGFVTVFILFFSLLWTLLP